MTRRVRARNRVCRLDELHARVERLEQSRSFGYRDHVAQRRRVVVELRSSGLSIAAIAKQFGLAASTVERDLQQTPHEPRATCVGWTASANRPAKVPPATARAGVA